MGGLFTQSSNHLFGWLGIQSLSVNQSVCPLVSQSVCQSIQLVSLSVSRYGGLLTLSTQLIKPSYLVTPPPQPSPLPTVAALQFLWKLTLVIRMSVS